MGLPKQHRVLRRVTHRLKIALVEGVQHATWPWRPMQSMFKATTAPHSFALRWLVTRTG